MPVRIRLSRGGAKKRPFYRIVVADSRRARDGKFIDQVGTYNPMLLKDNPERIKIDVEKTKDWMAKGAQPSDRVILFLSILCALYLYLFIFSKPEEIAERVVFLQCKVIENSGC